MGLGVPRGEGGRANLGSASEILVPFRLVRVAKWSRRVLGWTRVGRKLIPRGFCDPSWSAALPLALNETLARRAEKDCELPERFCTIGGRERMWQEEVGGRYRAHPRFSATRADLCVENGSRLEKCAQSWLEIPPVAGERKRRLGVEPRCGNGHEVCRCWDGTHRRSSAAADPTMGERTR